MKSLKCPCLRVWHLTHFPFFWAFQLESLTSIGGWTWLLLQPFLVISPTTSNLFPSFVSFPHQFASFVSFLHLCLVFTSTFCFWFRLSFSTAEGFHFVFAIWGFAFVSFMLKHLKSSCFLRLPYEVLISCMFGCLWMFLCVVVDWLFSDITAFCFVCGFPSYKLIYKEAYTRQVLFFLFYFFACFVAIFFLNLIFLVLLSVLQNNMVHLVVFLAFPHNTSTSVGYSTCFIFQPW